ncbi:MAG: tetratricopeptide repeat protein [Prevotellaceae bacterium]|jgi:TolA-binding protein|nr:tetratricopeptide repeat protein [Prevotellaceae bacterium]
MKKILIIVFLGIVSLATAQKTSVYTNPENLFYEGKTLYAERKFAASINSLENYLKTADRTTSETVQETHYYLAANAFELRKETALFQLKKYLADYPYSPFVNQVNFMLGTSEYEKRNFKDAASWFAAVDIDKLSQEDYIDYLFRYGYSELQLKRYRNSKYLFGQLIGRNTRYENAATYYYAYNEYTQKNYKTALDGFLKVQNVPEYQDFVPYYLVQIYYYQKEYATLIPIAEGLIKKNPKNENNIELYRILGECYYQKKEYQKTIDYLSAYQKSSKKVVRNDMYLLGISYFNLKKYPEAADNLSKVITEKDAVSQNAYLHLGLSYLNLKQTNNARLAFQQAAKMDFDKDTQEEASYNYALTTYELSFSPFNESVLAFEAFLNDYPNSKYKEKVYDYLINVYLTTSNYEAAYQSIEKLRNPSPRILEAKQRILLNMGIDAYTGAKYDKAIELFTNSLKLSAYDKTVAAQARYWRADSYYRQSKFDLARKDYNDFLLSPGARLTKEFNLANYNVGYTYFNQKDYAAATSGFRKFIVSEKDKKTKTYVDALNRIGDSYFAQKDLSNAFKYYSDGADLKAAGADYAAFQKGFTQGLQKDYSKKIATMQALLRDFPTSEYNNNAMYEIGHAYVMLDETDKAINAFDDLYRQYPQSSAARKGLLQKGMLYYNENQYDNAIYSYKQVVNQFPQSEEAGTALEGLEKIYVQTNRVSEYTAYVKTLKNVSVNITAEKEDSLTYLAAEKQYIQENIGEASKYLAQYLKKYPQGRYALKAHYYLADCYYTTDNKAAALDEYKTLLLQEGGNPYMEKSAQRAAEITFDKKDYAEALNFYTKLKEISESKDNLAAARLGILRCNAYLNNLSGVVAIANEMLANPALDVEQTREARYRRANAYISLHQPDKAKDDLTELAKEPRHIFGAEANYLLADYYFGKNEDSTAEKVIFDFIDKNTPHQYWLARGFILLSDIYIKKGDDFQAKQYLLSLQETYTKNDSIQEMITQRLNEIDKRDKAVIVTEGSIIEQKEEE